MNASSDVWSSNGTQMTLMRRISTDKMDYHRKIEKIRENQSNPRYRVSAIDEISVPKELEECSNSTQISLPVPNSSSITNDASARPLVRATTTINGYERI